MFRRACGRSSLSVQSTVPVAKLVNFTIIAPPAGGFNNNSSNNNSSTPAWTRSRSGVTSVTTCASSVLQAAITPTLVSNPFAHHQIRGAWWNNSSSGNAPAPIPAQEQEIPEVFPNQPEEIDDYIRPDKTIFERVEDWWDYMYNFFSPSEIVADTMMSMHNSGILFGMTGPMSWPAVLFAWGLLMRGCTLPFNLYVARNASRLAMIQGPLNEIKQQMETAKKDKSISTADKKVITDGIKRKKKAIEKKANASLWKSGLVVCASPFLVSSFVAIRTLCTYEETLETEGFMWIPDLTCADPLVIMPATCLVLFLANMEATMAVNSGGRSNMSVWFKYGGRLGGCLFLYFVLQHQPAAMFSYWIGMSIVGLFNPLLQTNETFRKYFKFPPRPAAAIEKEKENPMYKLLVKLGVRKEIMGTNVKNAAGGLVSSPNSSGSQEKPAYQSIHDFEIVEEEDAATIRAMKSGAKVREATK